MLEGQCEYETYNNVDIFEVENYETLANNSKLIANIIPVENVCESLEKEPVPSRELMPDTAPGKVPGSNQSVPSKELMPTTAPGIDHGNNQAPGISQGNNQSEHCAPNQPCAEFAHLVAETMQTKVNSTNPDPQFATINHETDEADNILFYGNKFDFPQGNTVNDYDDCTLNLPEILRGMCQQQVSGSPENLDLEEYILNEISTEKEKKSLLQKGDKYKEVVFNNICSEKNSLREIWMSFGSNTFSTLIDTGASHNLMSVQAMELLPTSEYTYKRVKIAMSTASGIIKNNVIGELTTQAELITADNKTYKIQLSFLVAKQLAGYDTVLGNGFLASDQWKPILDVQNLNLYIKNQYVQFPFHLSIRNGFDRFGLVEERTEVPPNSKKKINIIVNQLMPKAGFRNTTVYMEGSNLENLKNVIVEPCVNTLEPLIGSNFGRTFVMINNKSEQNIWLEKNSQIAVVQFKKDEVSLDETEFNNLIAGDYDNPKLKGYFNIIKKAHKKERKRRIRFKRKAEVRIIDEDGKEGHEDDNPSTMEDIKKYYPEIILPDDAEQMFDGDLPYGETYLPEVNESEVIKESSIEDADFSQNSEQEKQMIQDLLKQFPNIIAKSKLDVGCTDYVEHLIQIDPTKKLTSQKQRFMSEEKLQYADKALDTWLKMGIISVCETPKLKSNMCLVPRVQSLHDVPERTRASKYRQQFDDNKTSSWRICIDHRSLNAITLNQMAPNCVKPEDIIRKLSNKHVSCLDLSNGYHVIRLSPSSKDYTAFYHRRKLYRFERLCQGLTGAPYTFGQFMAIVFSQENFNRVKLLLSDEERKLLGPVQSFEEFIDYFFDDIYLFSDEGIVLHCLYLKCMFMALAMGDCKVGINKCIFYAKEVKVLGVSVNTGDAETYIEKQRAMSILSWPKPSSLAEIQSRICSLGYFSRYLPYLRNILAPFYMMMRKGEFTWNDTCEKAWTSMKALIIADIKLTIPDPEDQLVLCTDASVSAVNQILFCIKKESEFRVVATNSKILSSLDTLKSTHFKEALSLALGFKQYFSYLASSKKAPLVFCDARNLITLNKMKEHSIFASNMSSYLAKMSQVFKYNVYSIPSELNLLSDLFSRSFSRSRFVESNRYAISKEFAKTLPDIPAEFCVSSEILYRYLTGTMLPDRSDRGNRNKKCPKPIATLWKRYNGLTPEHAYSSAILLLKQICKNISRSKVDQFGQVKVHLTKVEKQDKMVQEVDAWMEDRNVKKPTLDVDECSELLSTFRKGDKEEQKKLITVISRIIDQTLGSEMEGKLKTRIKNTLVENFIKMTEMKSIPEISVELQELLGAEKLREHLLNSINHEVMYNYSAGSQEEHEHNSEEMSGRQTDPDIEGLTIGDDEVTTRHDLDIKNICRNLMIQEVGAEAQETSDNSSDTYAVVGGVLTVKQVAKPKEIFYRSSGDHPPSIGYRGDAGIDLPCQEDHVLQANERKMIDLQIQIVIPSSCVGLLTAKSGAGSKNISTHLGVIDCNFQGTIKVIVHNLNASEFKLQKGKAYCQLLLVQNVMPGALLKVQEIKFESERGEGEFGSSSQETKLTHVSDLLSSFNVTTAKPTMFYNSRIMSENDLDQHSEGNKESKSVAKTGGVEYTSSLFDKLNEGDKQNLVDIFLDMSAEKIAKLNSDFLKENKLTKENLIHCIMEDEYFGAIYQHIQAGRSFRNFNVRNGLLSNVRAGKTKLCIPSVILPNVINHVHKQTGHCKAHKTVEVFNLYFYHPRTTYCAKQLVRSCVTCKVAGGNIPVENAYDKRTLTAEYPRDIYAVDLLPNLPMSDGHTSAIVLIDEYSSYLTCIPLKKMNAEHIEHKLRDVLTCLGTPRTVRSDCDQRLLLPLKNLQSTMMFKIATSTPYEHKQLSRAELAVKHIKQKLSRMIFNAEEPMEKTQWTQILPLCCQQINGTVLTGCKRTRRQIFFNDKQPSFFRGEMETLILGTQVADANVDEIAELEARTVVTNEIPVTRADIGVGDLVTVLNERPPPVGTSSQFNPKMYTEIFKVQEEVNDKLAKVQSLKNGDTITAPYRKMNKLHLNEYLCLLHEKVLAPEVLNDIRTRIAVSEENTRKLFDVLPIPLEDGVEVSEGAGATFDRTNIAEHQTYSVKELKELDSATGKERIAMISTDERIGDGKEERNIAPPQIYDTGWERPQDLGDPDQESPYQYETSVPNSENEGEDLDKTRRRRKIRMREIAGEKTRRITRSMTKPRNP